MQIKERILNFISTNSVVRRMRNLELPMFTFFVFLLTLVRCAYGGPPDLTGPVVPRAKIHGIFPDSAPVGGSYMSTNGRGVSITVSGKYLTEEYGGGVLRCKFTFPAPRAPLVVLARRTTGGCQVRPDRNYEECPSTQARCDLPMMENSIRIGVQITNDFGILNYTGTDGPEKFLYEGGEGRWSLEDIYFTYVPKVVSVAPIRVPVGANETITIKGRGLNAIENRSLVCVFVNAGFEAMLLPSTKAYFNRHRPVTFQEQIRENNSSHFEIAEAYIHNNETISCRTPTSDSENKSLPARTLFVSVSPDFCPRNSLNDSKTGTCNHMSPLKRSGGTLSILPVVSKLDPTSGPRSHMTKLQVFGTGYPSQTNHYIKTSASNTNVMKGAFEVFAPVFSDDFESRDWSSQKMALEPTPAMDGFNVQKQWKEGPELGSVKYVPKSISGKIVPGLGGYRGRRTGVSRTGSGGLGSLMLKKSSADNTEQICDGFYRSVNPTVFPSKFSFWVMSGNITGASGFLTITSGDKDSCGKSNQTIFEFGSLKDKWQYRYKTEFHNFSYVMREPNVWYNIVLMFDWDSQSIVLTINGHGATLNIPFVCGSACKNIGAGFKTVFLYNKHAHVSATWDDFFLTIGPSVPIDVDANSRKLQRALTEKPFIFEHGNASLSMRNGTTRAARVILIGKPVQTARLDYFSISKHVGLDISKSFGALNEYPLQLVVCSRAENSFVVTKTLNISSATPEINLGVDSDTFRVLIDPPVFIPPSTEKQYIGLAVESTSQSVFSFHMRSEIEQVVTTTNTSNSSANHSNTGSFNYS